MLAAYGGFLCCYFYFTDYSDPYRYFARFLFVLGLFVIAPGLRGTWKHPVFLPMTAYMAWLLLSGFWSEPLDWYQLGQKFTISLYLFGFIAITHYLVEHNSHLFERMLQVSTLAAGASALFSIVVFYRANPFPATRLEGTGSLTNVNEFATVYGVFAVLAGNFALRCESSACKSLFMLAVGIFICFAWFGQCRMVLFALLVTLWVLTGTTLKEKKALMLLLPVFLITALALLFQGAAEGAWHRGLGLRPEIWAALFNDALRAPLAGHGLVSPISVEAGDKVFGNAHSAYLQVFWQGGLLGLGSFLVLLVMALRHAWYLGVDRGDYVILCLFVFAAMVFTTDLDTLIARPREQWLLFWLPLALLFSYRRRATGTGPPPARSAAQQGRT
jgi:O-antigen ligase